MSKSHDKAEILAEQIGAVTEIRYRRAGEKRTHRHTFGRGVKLYATNAGDALIIQGGRMSVRRFIEH